VDSLKSCRNIAIGTNMKNRNTEAAQANNTFSVVFKNMASFIAAIGGLTIILSIIYNIYFFNVFDKDFILELSINDHVATGISFLPAVLTVTLIFILFYFIFLYFQKARLLENLLKKMPRK